MPLKWIHTPSKRFLDKRLILRYNATEMADQPRPHKTHLSSRGLFQGALTVIFGHPAATPPPFERLVTSSPSHTPLFSQPLQYFLAPPNSAAASSPPLTCVQFCDPENPRKSWDFRPLPPFLEKPPSGHLPSHRTPNAACRRRPHLLPPGINPTSLAVFWVKRLPGNIPHFPYCRASAGAAYSHRLQPGFSNNGFIHSALECPAAPVPRRTVYPHHSGRRTPSKKELTRPYVWCNSYISGSGLRCDLLAGGVPTLPFPQSWQPSFFLMVSFERKQTT